MREALREVFGCAGFRPGQDAMIDALLDGRHALTGVPTGSGKSLCFQVPTLVVDGLTVVVLPLIALMQDQVSALRLAGRPLTGLRQSFLDGSLTRLVGPDAVLRRRIVEFIGTGAVGLASGTMADGGYERIWHAGPVGAEEVAFEPNIFLLTKARSEEIQAPTVPRPQLVSDADTPTLPTPGPDAEQEPGNENEPHKTAAPVRLRLTGVVPSEIWNRLGTKVVPRLRVGKGLVVEVKFRSGGSRKRPRHYGRRPPKNTGAIWTWGDQTRIEWP